MPGIVMVRGLPVRALNFLFNAEICVLTLDASGSFECLNEYFRMFFLFCGYGKVLIRYLTIIDSVLEKGTGISKYVTDGRSQVALSPAAR